MEEQGGKTTIESPIQKLKDKMGRPTDHLSQAMMPPHFPLALLKPHPMPWGHTLSTVLVTWEGFSALVLHGPT
jgi:hypothetical protein